MAISDLTIQDLPLENLHITSASLDAGVVTLGWEGTIPAQRLQKIRALVQVQRAYADAWYEGEKRTRELARLDAILAKFQALEDYLSS